jgi:lipopolysaccharide transport system ATP-binding protein
MPQTFPESDIAIRVRGLGKKYTIGGPQEKYLTMRDAIVNSMKAPFRRLATRGADQSTNEFWALKDVSFDVHKGEVVGIIGRNGAGKSTLLKILSRITTPTEGEVELHGRVGSLLEVGTGFHPEMTGRENIFLNGSILGMKKNEIEQKFDEIVRFAEIDKFIDTPVKRYSSGMYVRLAFAVAAHLEPEILVVDEVLAVGDAGFQKKCLGKMGEVAKEGRTVLFVSHNMGAIRQLCSEAILLDAGHIVMSGDVEQIIQIYHQKNLDKNNLINLRERKDRKGNGNVYTTNFSARDSESGSSDLRAMLPADLIIEYESRQISRISRLFVGVGIESNLGVPIFTVSTSIKNSDFFNLPPQGKIVCHIPKIPLIPGRYIVKIKLMDVHGLSDFITNAGSFNVVGYGDGDMFLYSSGGLWGSIIVPHIWIDENIGGVDSSI